jgi:hypothetical protein
MLVKGRNKAIMMKYDVSCSLREKQNMSPPPIVNDSNKKYIIDYFSIYLPICALNISNSNTFVTFFLKSVLCSEADNRIYTKFQ